MGLTVADDAGHTTLNGIAPRFHVLGWPQIAAPLPAIHWACEGLNLAPGRPWVFCGEAGANKSWFAQAMLVHACTEVPMLGRFTFRRGLRCLYVDYEQGERESRLRFQQIVRGMECEDLMHDRIGYVWQPIETWNPKGLGDRERVLDDVCDLARGYDMVVIDSLLDCQPGVDENSTEVTGPMKLATKASERTGAAFGFIDHASGKAQATRGNAQRGHSAKKGASSVLLVASGSYNEPVTVTCERSQNAPFARWPQPFAYDLQDVSGGVVLTSVPIPSEGSARVSDDWEKIVNALKSCPGSTREELRELTGVAKGRLEALVQSKTKEGVVKMNQKTTEKGGRSFFYTLT